MRLRQTSHRRLELAGLLDTPHEQRAIGRISHSHTPRRPPAFVSVRGNENAFALWGILHPYQPKTICNGAGLT